MPANRTFSVVRAFVNFLLDTNHWSYLQRRHEGVMRQIRALPADSKLYMPVIAQAELLAGVETVVYGRRKDELRALYEETIERAAEVLPIDSRVAVEFAQIYSQLRQAGRPIGTNDIWIAATARVHDATLATSDPDFGSVPKLRLVDWTK